MYEGISPLTPPEHRICLPWDANRIKMKATRSLISFLKLDVISYDDMCKQSLDLVSRKEPTRADHGRGI